MSESLDKQGAAEAGFRDAPVSFVRRSGRMSSGQERAWEQFNEKYLLDLPRDRAATSLDPTQQVDPAELFATAQETILEIGSGQGHAILHACAQNPAQNFIAVEVFQAGLARTMGVAGASGIENLRLVEGNAPELLDVLAPASLSEIWIFFPDPWHKKRHHKRRLIKAELLAQIQRALKPGGVVRLATDWQEYAEQMREVFDADAAFERDFAGDWAPRFDGRVLTAFEIKGTAVGRDIRDLSYRLRG